MNTSLPSYQTATARDPLALVAPCIRRQDLLRASLVCRRWHTVFSKELWTSPERFWVMGDRNALRGFMLFLRSIINLPATSRPTTTHHTTTFNLSSVNSSIYTSLPQNWFHLLLCNLPHLVHLNVSNINILSYDNLMYFSRQLPPVCAYNLQAFIAKGCHNLTAAGLEGFLRIGWPHLEVLDLSSSHGAAQAKPIAVIANGALLPSLRKLVLRNLELRDGVVEILAKGLGTRIRELDIRGNLVSDVGIQYLLNYCFLPPEYEVGDRIVLGQLGYAVPPPLGRKIGGTQGLTDLLISKNPKVSWAAVENLIKTTRLESFDCGMIPDFDALAAGSRKRLPLPVLSMYAHKNLHTLRIDIRIIAPMASKMGESVLLPNDDAYSELNLKPTMLPSLRRLVLCGVPYYTPSSFRVMDGLKRFLDELADVEADAGRRYGTVGLTYLKLLVLEMQALTVTEDEKDGGVGMYASSSSGRPGRRNSDSEDDEDEESVDSDGDFSFFGEGQDEGKGGWSDSLGKKQRGEKNEKKGKEKETLVNVLSELERFREQGRRGVGKYWRGEVRVVRDMGWDDEGGMEKGSVGVEKWGVVEERV